MFPGEKNHKAQFEPQTSVFLNVFKPAQGLLIQSVWGGVLEFVFLTNLQVIMMLGVWEHTGISRVLHRAGGSASGSGETALLRWNLNSGLK